MAHFRGIVTGNRGPVSRLGSKGSGLQIRAESWEGAVQVLLRHDEETGHDMVLVELDTHYGQGVSRTLYQGLVSGK